MDGVRRLPRKLYPGGQPQLVKDLAAYTLDEYYDPNLSDEIHPEEGYMIPVTPERRFTNSPTGGVRGRYLAKGVVRPPPPPWPLGNTTGGTPNSFNDMGDENRPKVISLRENYQPSLRESLFGPDPKGPADLTFLVEPAPPGGHPPRDMSRLVSAHGSRPGGNVLRYDAKDGKLYACIPTAPMLPPPRRQPARNNIIKHRQGCDHCESPPSRILHAQRLCGFHAVYVATGRFPSRYEAAALVELDYAGLGPGHGWSVEETVDFVGELGRRMEYMLLVLGSEPEWPARPARDAHGAVAPSPWGAIGDRAGTQPEQGVVPEMGPRIGQVYQESMRGETWQ